MDRITVGAIMDTAEDDKNAIQEKARIEMKAFVGIGTCIRVVQGNSNRIESRTTPNAYPIVTVELRGEIHRARMIVQLQSRITAVKLMNTLATKVAQQEDVVEEWHDSLRGMARPDVADWRYTAEKEGTHRMVGRVFRIMAEWDLSTLLPTSIGIQLSRKEKPLLEKLHERDEDEEVKEWVIDEGVFTDCLRRDTEIFPPPRPGLAYAVHGATVGALASILRKGLLAAGRAEIHCGLHLSQEVFATQAQSRFPGGVRMLILPNWEKIESEGLQLWKWYRQGEKPVKGWIQVKKDKKTQTQ
jgi:hypothetical protein